jgi:hypothetical protein
VTSGHAQPAFARLAVLAAVVLAGAGTAAAGFLGLVTGALPVDVGVGRRARK